MALATKERLFQTQKVRTIRVPVAELDGEELLFFVAGSDAERIARFAEKAKAAEARRAKGESIDSEMVSLVVEVGPDVLRCLIDETGARWFGSEAEAKDAAEKLPFEVLTGIALGFLGAYGRASPGNVEASAPPKP